MSAFALNGDDGERYFANSFERFVAAATARIINCCRPSGAISTSSAAAVVPPPACAPVTPTQPPEVRAFDEHFIPPDPGPVMGGDPLLTMAWMSAAGMPIFLMIVVIAWPTAPQALVAAAAIVFVLGVAVLLWRMPNRRTPGDDDTGAVV